MLPDTPPNASEGSRVHAAVRVGASIDVDPDDQRSFEPQWRGARQGRGAFIVVRTTIMSRARHDRRREKKGERREDKGARRKASCTAINHPSSRHGR